MLLYRLRRRVKRFWSWIKINYRILERKVLKHFGLVKRVQRLQTRLPVSQQKMGYPAFDSNVLMLHKWSSPSIYLLQDLYDAAKMICEQRARGSEVNMLPLFEAMHKLQRTFEEAGYPD